MIISNKLNYSSPQSQNEDEYHSQNIGDSSVCAVRLSFSPQTPGKHLYKKNTQLSEPSKDGARKTWRGCFLSALQQV